MPGRTATSPRTRRRTPRRGAPDRRAPARPASSRPSRPVWSVAGARLVACSTGCCRRRRGGRSDRSTATVDDLYPSRPTPCAVRCRRGSPSSRPVGSPPGAPWPRSASPRWPCRSGHAACPQWPAGVVGSITHCAGLVAAAVGWSADWWALGIDAEPAVALDDDVRDAVTTPVERAGPADPLDATVVFCAKEAFYKCWSALDGAVLEFTDVEVAFDGPVVRGHPGGRRCRGRGAGPSATGSCVTAAWWAAGTRGRLRSDQVRAWRSTHRALTR